jgi:hypothetical protein
MTTATAAITSQDHEVQRETGNSGSPPGNGQTGGEVGNPPSPHSQHEVDSAQYLGYYYELSPGMHKHWRRRNRRE